MNENQFESLVLEYGALDDELKKKKFKPRYLNHLKMLPSDPCAATFFSADIDEELSELIEKHDRYEDLETHLRKLISNSAVLTSPNGAVRGILQRLTLKLPTHWDLEDFLQDARDNLKAENPFLSKDQVSSLALLYEFGEERLKIYVGRLIEISLVTRGDVSPEMAFFVDELRQAYALNLPNSVYALCRTCIERTAIEAGWNSGFVPQDWYDPKRNEVYCKDSVYKMRNILDKVTKGDRELFNTTYRDLYQVFNSTIHGREPANDRIIREKIRETLRVIRIIRAINSVS